MTEKEILKENISKALISYYGQSPIYFEVILEIPIFWQGWEMDDKAYVVTTSKNHKLFINSNHGSLFVDTNWIEFLKQKIEEYDHSKKITTKALDLLGKKK